MPDYDSSSAESHRCQAPAAVACAVITVSDTRTLEDDRSGDAVCAPLTAAGHSIAERRIVTDDPQKIAAAVRELANRADIDAVLLTGGTGIAARDLTPEAVAPLFTKSLPGYSELLRMLSYEEIGAAAMLSRATGGLVGQTVVLTMPGSTAAVRLAMDKLIVPELPHLVSHARKG